MENFVNDLEKKALDAMSRFMLVDYITYAAESASEDVAKKVSDIEQILYNGYKPLRNDDLGMTSCINARLSDMTDEDIDAVIDAWVKFKKDVNEEFEKVIDGLRKVKYDRV